MIITLLTDFGTSDGYVAELKGALLRRVPTAVLVDVAHDLAPGDVAAAAYVLGRTWGAFPDGTVHLAVVDPGVGTPRRALAGAVGGHRFAAPDNGLLTPVLEGRAADLVALEVPPGASPTFHGRDVFAPAAARLAAGEPLGALGQAVLDPVRLGPAPLERRGGDLVGAVVHVDRFGTLVTNLPEGRVAPGAQVRVGVYDLALQRTFGDVPPGDPVAYVGSGGTIEIAVRGRRADAALGLTRGAEVRASARTGSV
jgi:S-adenosyl-L-methionine hydrolase (adenosine-forming)